MWRFRVLGSLEVEAYGSAVALPAPKHRALLLKLLLSNGSLCSTDRLLEDLWDDPPASAGKILQAYVSHLRSLLGTHTIETLPTGYRIRVEPNSIDAHRFDELVRRARACADAGDHLVSGALARRALALWRGPALADVAYQSFAQSEAARLEELRLQCLELSIDAELASGHPERVIADLVSLVASHPEREPLHERLALALYRSDRQSDALSTIASARRHLAEEFGLEPGRGLRTLEHAILTQDTGLHLRSAVAADEVHSVPVPDDDLVGRRRELDELLDLLIHDEVRLVTISGPGGSGKTRVALEAARRARPYFAHGTAFVELASITDPALVLPTVAKALGLVESATSSAAEVVGDWLRRRQMLLVVDTFEHVTDAALELADLLRDASQVSVLVTSRRVLHLRAERVYPLGPMALDDAERLFAARVRAREPLGHIDPNDESVRDICIRLDCLPLALEIAAARAAVDDPATVRDRLRADLGTLGSGPRDAPARQQTLTDTIRWTTAQLSPDEQRALARLSTFVGGCGHEVAAKVCETDLETLTALVEWNLVDVTMASSSPRLTMLDTIRHHAGQLAGELGLRTYAELAHATHHLQLAESLFRSGSSQPETLRQLDPELDNLRAAYDRALAREDRETALRIATALHPYWYVRGLYREGRDRVTESLSGWTPVPALHARACRVLAGLHYLLGDDDEADAFAARGIDAGSGLDDRYEVMACHTVRGVVAQRRGDLAQARRQILASGDLARAMGRELDVIIAETNLGDIALTAGQLDRARSHFECAHDFHRARGSDGSFALIGLGSVARRQGRLHDAEQHLTEALAEARSNDRHQNVVSAELALAAVRCDRGELEAAARSLGSVRSVTERFGIELLGGDLEDQRRIEAAVLSGAGQERFDQWLRQGRVAADATLNGTKQPTTATRTGRTRPPLYRS